MRLDERKPALIMDTHVNQSSSKYCVQKQWTIPEIPKDTIGFIKSFKLHEEVQLLEFFDEFGFVVIDGVLDEQSTKNTIDEIWSELEGKTVEYLSSIGLDITTLSRGEQLYLEAVELEKDGRPMEASEKYRLSFHLCPQLEDELFSQNLIKRTKAKIVDRNNSATWETKNWAVASRVGFLGVDVCVGPMSWNNRQNPNIYRAFSTLLNKKDLWVSVDRFGVMRPTKNVPIGMLPPDQHRTEVHSSSNDNNSTAVTDKDEWRSAMNWTHWDMNPCKSVNDYINLEGLWTLYPEKANDYAFEDFMGEYNDTKHEGCPKLQGVLVLSESKEDDGGFCLVPGFHKLLKEWCSLNVHTEFAQNNMMTKSVGLNVPSEDPLHELLAKITARSGSLIIWRGEMPHCSYPNNSNRFRMVQYIRMIPAHEGAPGTGARKMQVENLLPKSLPITELGQRLFSLQSWSG